MDVWAIFLTGLFAGGLTCMAVQGGLLATTIAHRHEQKLQGKLVSGNAAPIVVFLLAKLIAYTFLGALLGWVGSFFQLSLMTKVVLQVAVGIFMVGTALNLLQVHPIFRYFVIQPPKFLTRIVRKQSKSTDFFAPAFLGVFTIFIPCGTTQAIMALAVASAHPLTGALMLFAFTLGTSPLFFLLGYFAQKLGDVMQKGFSKVAGYTILLLAVWNINGAVTLAGSPITLDTMWGATYCTFSFCTRATAATPAPRSEQTITINASGYSPTNLSVKAGSQVTLHVKNENGRGCQQAFTIPSLGVQKVIQVGQEEVITFTAPKTPQQLAFMCSMGMYRGRISVI